MSKKPVVEDKALPPPLPSSGGSFARQPDGSLKRVEITAEPPAGAPSKEA